MPVTKNVLLNSYSSKKREKDSDDFWIENWIWKTNFGTFWHLPINPILKILLFSIGMLIFRQKSFQFCIPCLKTQQPVLPYSIISQWTKLADHLGSVPTDLANWGPSGPGPDHLEKETDKMVKKMPKFDYTQCSCMIYFWDSVIKFL